MDINMTLLLALSVLLASPCHLAAPEFFVRDLGAGVFLDTFLFLLHWGQLSRGGILSLCFKDRSQSSFHAGWGGGEYWKLGSCPLFPFELFPSFSYWKLIVGLAFLLTWIISIFWNVLFDSVSKCSSWLQPPNVPFNLPLINVPSELCLFCPLLHNSMQRCYLI